MRLSVKTTYGIQALLDLALHDNENNVKVSDIARRQKVPRHYLSHLMRDLVSGGLVHSVRGPAGGVRLARPAERISMDEIYLAMEGPLRVENTDERNEGDEMSAIMDFQQEIFTSIEGVLKKTTLSDIVARVQHQRNAGTLMYNI